MRCGTARRGRVRNEEVTRSPCLGKQKHGVLAVATTGLFSKSMPLTDVRLRGFIVRAHQEKTAQRHVAQPKPELCGSAWASLKSFISPQLSLTASSANRRTSPAHRESIPSCKVYWRTMSACTTTSGSELRSWG
jgi:hypothetical protein